MPKICTADWINRPEIKAILDSFSVPKTPREVEKGLSIGKLKIKPFVEKGLLISLNPYSRKGRFYILTDKARKLLKLPPSTDELEKPWNLIGWLSASPKGRLVILKAVDSKKRNSEEIRSRASRDNPHLSRISTKELLNSLVDKDLIETELIDRRRYYWITEKGKLINTVLGAVVTNCVYSWPPGTSS